MKPTKNDLPILMLCMGTLIFPFILKERILQQWALVNFPVWLTLCYAYQAKIIQLSSPKTGTWILSPYLLIGLLLLFLVPGNGWSLKRKTLLIMIYLLPAVFLCCDITNPKTANRFSTIWHICLRTVCLFMCLCWCIDALAGKPVLQSWLTDLYAHNGYHYYLLVEHRFISYFGHPLASAGIFLSLLVWTTINSNSGAKPDKLYLMDTAISLFGIFVCASKAALMLAAILLIYNCIQRRSISEILILVLLLTVFHLTGISSVLFSRIEEGAAAGDLSTGRAEAAAGLASSSETSIRLFRGNVFEYDNTWMIAALELPFLGWAFLCGIAFAILQYLMYFVYPGLRVLLSGNITLLACMLVLMAYANANNGIHSFNDDLLIYSLNLWLILQSAPKENILKKLYEKN